MACDFDITKENIYDYIIEDTPGADEAIKALSGICSQRADSQAILKAKDNDTIVTGRIAGTPVRVLKNEMSREYVKQEKAGADKMELEKYTLGSLRKAVFDGDTMNGSLMAGQVAGQIDKIQPIEKIFEQIYEEYEAVRKELYAD